MCEIEPFPGVYVEGGSELHEVPLGVLAGVGAALVRLHGPMGKYNLDMQDACHSKMSTF